MWFQLDGLRALPDVKNKGEATAGICHETCPVFLNNQLFANSRLARAGILNHILSILVR